MENLISTYIKKNHENNGPNLSYFEKKKLNHWVFVMGSHKKPKI